MEPNPFWSERLRDEHNLQALRPAGLPERSPDHELPPVPADEWEQGEEAGGETPRPVADGNLGGRLGDTERSAVLKPCWPRRGRRRPKSGKREGWLQGHEHGLDGT